MGYSFHWPSYSKYPYFETHKGNIIWLEVYSYVPYIRRNSGSVQKGMPKGIPGCPGTADVDPEWLQWSVPEKSARYYRNEFRARSTTNGPIKRTIRKRVTMDLHTREILEASNYNEEEALQMRSEEVKDYETKGPRDILTYVWYEKMQPVVDESVPRADETSPNDDKGDRDENYGKLWRNTKEEATSLKHLLLHLPKNKHCDACNRAKKQYAQNRRIKQGPIPEFFGDEVTCDNWIITPKNGINLRGIDGETCALVFRDRATNWVQCVPQKKHTKQETKSALQYIKGIETFVRFHSDGSGEIDQACKEMEVLHTISPPSIPQKNSRAERSNRHVLEGARTLMENSGVPQRFWIYAVTYFCLSNNAWNWKADSNNETTKSKNQTRPNPRILRR